MLRTDAAHSSSSSFMLMFDERDDDANEVSGVETFADVLLLGEVDLSASVLLSGTRLTSGEV